MAGIREGLTLRVTFWGTKHRSPPLSMNNLCKPVDQPHFIQSVNRQRYMHVCADNKV